MLKRKIKPVVNFTLICTRPDKQMEDFLTSIGATLLDQGFSSWYATAEFLKKPGNADLLEAFCKRSQVIIVLCNTRDVDSLIRFPPVGQLRNVSSVKIVCDAPTRKLSRGGFDLVLPSDRIFGDDGSVDLSAISDGLAHKNH